MPLTKIGQRLKRSRERAGLTQEFVARQLGVRDETVSRWERVGCDSVRTLEALAAIYKTPLGTLIFGETEKPNKGEHWAGSPPDDLAHNHRERAVLGIHRELVSLGIQPAFDAVVLAMLRALGVREPLIRKWERVFFADNEGRQTKKNRRMERDGRKSPLE